MLNYNRICMYHGISDRLQSFIGRCRRKMTNANDAEFLFLDSHRKSDLDGSDQRKKELNL